MKAFDTDLAAMNRDITSGNPETALSRYKGRFLAHGHLGSAQLNDWRDEVEEEVALAVSDLLQEQSHVCATADLERLIQQCEQLLVVHPHMLGAQVALIQATARSGQLQRAERIHQGFIEKDPEFARCLPPIDSFRIRTKASGEGWSAPFAGREDELGTLLESWERTQSGDGQVVVLLGEPGIGKTRLADQLLRRVAIRGGCVWTASCCAATQRLPYTVVSDLIREHISNDSLAPPQVPRGSQPNVPAESELYADEYRHRLTEYATSELIHNSQRQPVAVLVDDAQWADEYTSLLIAYWAYRLRRHRVMIVLTARTYEAEPPPDWILSDLGRPVRLTLDRISVAAAESIVRAFERTQGIVLDRHTRDAVLWQSAGRPFLLLEALASLVRGDPGKTSVVLSEPAESLLLRRFRSIDPDAALVAGALAVWARPMSEAAVRAMTNLADERLAAALNILHARGIAQLHDGVLTFPHELMRGTAYRALLPATKALYHRRAAAELQRTHAPAGLVAQQYAGAGDTVEAAQYSLRAAKEAWSSHAYSDYEYYCRLCLECGSTPSQKDAAVGLARYLVQVGRSAEIEDILHGVDGSSEEEQFLTSFSQLHRDLATGERSVTDLLESARTLVGDLVSREDPTLASLATTLFSVAFDACATEFEQPEFTAHSETRLTMDHDAELQMEAVVALWHGVTKNVGEGVQMARSALGQLHTSASPTTRSACLYSHGTLLLLAGLVNDARCQLDAALDIAQKIGDVRRQLSVHINNSVAQMESGELVHARQSLEKAATATNVHFRIRCYTNLAILHYEEGDSQLCIQAAEAVLSMNAAYQSPSLENTGRAMLGLVALEQRDYETAKIHAQAINQHAWISLDDVSYTAMFLSRILRLSGKEAEALLLLTDSIRETKPRNVLCAMRLEAEKASFLVTSEPDSAYRLARNLETRALELGARRLQVRAREVLLQVKTGSQL